MGPYQSVETNPLVGVFPTKDGRWIGLSMLQPGRFWDGFCRHLGREDLITDPRFDTTDKVIANAREAGAIIAAEFKARTYAEWVERFRTLDAPWEPVQNSLELGQDRQLLANGLVGEVTDIEGRTQRLVVAPVQFDERPAELRQRAAIRGAHRRDFAGARGHGVGALGVEGGGRRYLIDPGARRPEPGQPPCIPWWLYNFPMPKGQRTETLTLEAIVDESEHIAGPRGLTD